MFNFLKAKCLLYNHSPTDVYVDVYYTDKKFCTFINTSPEMGYLLRLGNIRVHIIKY